MDSKPIKNNLSEIEKGECKFCFKPKGKINKDGVCESCMEYFKTEGKFSSYDFYLETHYWG